MKLREIILDFTSLLDVIMIILFWFIINYRAQAQEQIAQAEQSAAEAIASASRQMDEAEALRQQADAELQAMAEANEKQAENLQAMVEFGKGENVRIFLCMAENDWWLDVYKGETQLGTVDNDNDKQIGLKLNNVLRDAGYAADDTILCVFTYDSAEPGTRAAYQTVIRELNNIRVGNSLFFYSELDVQALKGDSD